MSIETKVSALSYAAATPEIDAAYDAIADAIEGRSAAPGIIALVRALVAVLTIAPEEADERSIAAVVGLLRNGVANFRRAGSPT